MATNWVISAHGNTTPITTGSGAKGFKLVQLPHGITVHFFVPESKIFYEGWEAYYPLMSSPPQFNQLANLSYYETFKKPALPDYCITGDGSWVDKNGNSASGIFIAGDTFHQDPRTSYIPDGTTLTLSQFFSGRTWQPGDQVFWLCCRVWA